MTVNLYNTRRSTTVSGPFGWLIAMIVATVGLAIIALALVWAFIVPILIITGIALLISGSGGWGILLIVVGSVIGLARMFGSK